MNHPDSDLRQLFARQRKLERSLTPAWRPELLSSKQKSAGTHSLRWLLPAAAGAVATALVVWMSASQPDALQDLPPLLAGRSPQDAPFLGLATAESDAQWPSDFLKSPHLNLIVP